MKKIGSVNERNCLEIQKNYVYYKNDFDEQKIHISINSKNT